MERHTGLSFFIVLVWILTPGRNSLALGLAQALLEHRDHRLVHA